MAASYPPAAIDIQRAAILPAQDKQKKETASVSAPLNQQDTGMSALSRTRALDGQVLSVEQLESCWAQHTTSYFRF